MPSEHTNVITSYTTKFVKNLRTGEPFEFHVLEKDIALLETQKQFLKEGSLVGCDSEKDLVTEFEFTLFPSYGTLVSRFQFDTVLPQMLREFGLEENIIERFIADDQYISSLKPWFAGIAYDGKRAATTIKMTYCRTLTCFQSYDDPSADAFMNFSAELEYFIDQFNGRM